MNFRSMNIVMAVLALLGIAGAFLPVGSDVWRAAAVAGAALLVPGWAMIRLLPWTRDAELPGVVAFAFPFSCVLYFGLLLSLQIAGAGYAPVRATIVIALAVSLLVIARDAMARPGGRTIPAWVIIAAILSVPISLGKGAEIGFTDDSLDHIAYIDEIRATGESFPKTAFYHPSSEVAFDARKGFLHPVLAATAELAEVDTVTLINALPALAAFFFTVSFFAVAREAVGSGPSTTIATILALLLYDIGIGGSWFGRSYTPFLFAGPLIWASLLLMLGAGKKDRPRPVPAFLCGFAVIGCHLFAAITVAGLTLLYCGTHLVVRRGQANLRSLLIAGCALAAGMVPLGVWRLIATWPAVDPIHTHLQGVVLVGKSLFFATPMLTMSRLGIAALIAVPLSLLLFRKAARDEGLLFVISITFLPYMIILNPLVVPLIVPVAGYLVGRLAWFGGNFLVLGVLAFDWIREISLGSGARRVGSAAALVLLFTVCAGTLWAGEDQMSWKRLDFSGARPQRDLSVDRWSDLFDHLNETVEPRSTIATDPLTGFMIPAFTTHKVIAVLSQHSSPADPAAPERLHDAAKILSPYVGGSETAALLDKYGADYVLIDFRFDRVITLYYGAIDPALYPATLEKFQSEPKRYRQIWSADRCHLFEIVRGDHSGEQYAPSILDASVDSVPSGANRLDTMFGNGVRLLAAEVITGEVNPGDPVEIACYWTRDEPSKDPLPYRLYFRMYHTGYEPRTSGHFAGKLLRKLDQARNGELYRARKNRNLVGGGYPPFAWPEGEIIADTIRAETPIRLATGEYRVELLLRRQPHMQTYQWRDFFAEDDSFSGKAVGTVLVGEGGNA